VGGFLMKTKITEILVTTCSALANKDFPFIFLLLYPNESQLGNIFWQIGCMRDIFRCEIIIYPTEELAAEINGLEIPDNFKIKIIAS
jgi:hypothetical protein